MDLVGWRVRPEAEHEFGLDGREAALEYRESDQRIRRREPDAPPENGAHQPVLPDPLEPGRPDAADFPARDIVRPERDRPILVGVGSIESRRDGSREVEQRLRAEPRPD